MAKVAVICASGIGDALLMQIAATQLKAMGHDVTVFSNFLGELRDWFPGCSFEKQTDSEEKLSSFDFIVLQRDNSEKAKKIHSLPKPVYSLYGSHELHKHGPLKADYDYVFDQSIPMAENISLSMQTLFGAPDLHLANGIKAPPQFTQHRFPKRVVIHPTSSAPSKNWLKSSFLKLKERLEKEGWDPVFIASPAEATEWESPLLPTLSDLAGYLYESKYFIGNDSGPGHLASNLGLKTVTIGPSKKQLAFWRPSWSRGTIVYPSQWLPKIKTINKNWMHLITVSNVIKCFTKLSDIK